MLKNNAKSENFTHIKCSKWSIENWLRQEECYTTIVPYATRIIKFDRKIIQHQYHVTVLVIKSPPTIPRAKMNSK